ncbi:unnamed protein product [Moneuplotes crassus]|uniref:Uncharacterized protein n=1 Tax=Euplotes crassus TaxID=5936 RepID=A0AAD1UEZ0_EUPCR|nr:unnamed protein product [Moneuplotes crassus]
MSSKETKLTFENDSPTKSKASKKGSTHSKIKIENQEFKRMAYKTFSPEVVIRKSSKRGHKLWSPNLSRSNKFSSVLKSREKSIPNLDIIDSIYESRQSRRMPSIPDKLFVNQALQTVVSRNKINSSAYSKTVKKKLEKNRSKKAIEISHCLYPTNVEMKNIEEREDSESCSPGKPNKYRSSPTGVKSWKKDLLNLKKDQFYKTKQSVIHNGVESFMLSTFHNNSKNHRSRFPFQKFRDEKEGKAEFTARNHSKLKYQTSAPFLGLAECHSSSPYKKHFMYGSMKDIKEGRTLNLKNTSQIITQFSNVISDSSSEERKIEPNNKHQELINLAEKRLQKQPLSLPALAKAKMKEAKYQREFTQQRHKEKIIKTSKILESISSVHERIKSNQKKIKNKLLRPPQPKFIYYDEKKNRDKLF